MDSGSLSTIENLFNSIIPPTPTPTPPPSSNQPSTNQQTFHNNNNSRFNSFNMSSITSEDPANLDKIFIRQSSPSFINDSEPPSYFEAIGISSNINANADNAQFLQQQQQQQPIKVNSNKDTIRPNHQRHHVICTQNIQPNLYQNQGYNCSSLSSNNNTMATNDSINYLKPSETYLVWSIFTTVYCVFIGVVALVLSIKVHHYNKQGDFCRAYSRSKIARNINIAGLFFGIIYMGIGLLACFLPIK